MDSNKRWVIYIDIEGIFEHYKRNEEIEVFRKIDDTLKSIYYIGTQIYNKEPWRLFVHQCFDGFFIVSSTDNEELKRPISIAVLLMRSAVLQNYVIKSAIAVEGVADVADCYSVKSENGVILLGEGLMTITRIMGKGMANAYKLSKQVSGPLLLIEDTEASSAIEFKNSKTGNFAFGLNWLSSEFNDDMAKLNPKENAIFDQKLLSNRMRDYVKENKKTLSENWQKNAQILLKMT